LIACFLFLIMWTASYADSIPCLPLHLGILTFHLQATPSASATLAQTRLACRMQSPLTSRHWRARVLHCASVTP
jgi:hypothetical protein